jgi:hypothetical protein
MLFTYRVRPSSTGATPATSRALLTTVVDVGECNGVQDHASVNGDAFQTPGCFCDVHCRPSTPTEWPNFYDRILHVYIGKIKLSYFLRIKLNKATINNYMYIHRKPHLKFNNNHILLCG